MNKLPEVLLGELLVQHKFTIAAAESCTGGLIMHRLTNIPGSSGYIQGGIVVYADETKIHFLGVKRETIASVGAVSEETAREMASGVRRLFSVDVGISVTGIAGPGGATPTKPVGLTYIGVATPTTLQVERYIWQGDREANKAASAEAALRLAIQLLTLQVDTP
jgi:PncC family amidohydrolase